jgi:hypothetical protein
MDNIETFICEKMETLVNKAFADTEMQFWVRIASMYEQYKKTWQ